MRHKKLIRKALSCAVFLGYVLLLAQESPHIIHCILVLVATLGGYWLYRRNERSRNVQNKES